MPDVIAQTLAELKPEPEPKPGSQPEDFEDKYKFNSGKRFVDENKNDFDKMLDELERIGKDFLDWETEKFTGKFLDKFKSDERYSDEEVREMKFDAFLGGFINAAAMILQENGYSKTALNRLERTKTAVTTKERIEEETQAIKTRVQETGDMVDLSDIFSGILSLGD